MNHNRWWDNIIGVKSFCESRKKWERDELKCYWRSYWFQGERDCLINWQNILLTGNSNIGMFQINRRSKSKQGVMIKMDWVKRSIQLNDKCLMLEKSIDFREVTSLTSVAVNYFESKNIVKWRSRGEYIWDVVLSRNNDYWLCWYTCNLLSELSSQYCLCSTSNIHYEVSYHKFNKRIDQIELKHFTTF